MPIFRTPSPITLSVPRRPRPIVPREQRETIEEHQAAQSAIEFGALKRQADETFNAALRAASEAPDPESSQAIFDKASQVVSKLQSKNIQVQNAISAHIEGSLAGWGEGFARQAKAAQEKRTLDQGKFEYEAALDRGDPLAAAKITQHMSTIAPEDRAIFDEMAANAESESAIRQVRGALADGDYVRARELAEKARGVLRSVEQREALARLEDVVGRAEREQKDSWLSELAGEAIAARALPAAEKHAKIEELRGALVENAANFSPESIRSMSGFFDGLEKDEAVVSDPIIKSDLVDRALSLRDDTPADEVTALRRDLDESLVMKKISNEDYESLRLSVAKVGERIDKTTSDAIDAVVQSGKERWGVNDLADLKWQVAKMAKEKEWTPEQIWVEGGKMLPSWKDRVQPAKEIYTPEHINMVYGALQIGGYRDPTSGAIVSWRDDKWSKAWEKAVAYSTLNLYGNDAALARAMEIIKQRYPEANIEAGKVSVPWTSLPEEVKQQDLDMLRKTKRAPWYSTSVYEPVGGWSKEAVAKAKEEDMTVAKFGTWLTETGQIRMVPATEKLTDLGDEELAQRYKQTTDPAAKKAIEAEARRRRDARK